MSVAECTYLLYHGLWKMCEVQLYQTKREHNIPTPPITTIRKPQNNRFEYPDCVYSCRNPRPGCI